MEKESRSEVSRPCAVDRLSAEASQKQLQLICGVVTGGVSHDVPKLSLPLTHTVAPPSIIPPGR